MVELQEKAGKEFKSENPYRIEIIGAITVICLLLVAVFCTIAFIHTSNKNYAVQTQRFKEVTAVENIVKTQHPEAYIDGTDNALSRVDSNHYIANVRFGTVEKFCDVMIAEKTMTCRGGIPKVTVQN